MPTFFLGLKSFHGNHLDRYDVMYLLLHNVLLNLFGLTIYHSFLIFFALRLKSIFVFEFFSLVEVGKSTIALEKLLNHPKNVKISHVSEPSLHTH